MCLLSVLLEGNSFAYAGIKFSDFFFWNLPSIGIRINPASFHVSFLLIFPISHSFIRILYNEGIVHLKYGGRGK